jgi:diaminohydroxyphosphoribosylaminopyrimidine deaminase/5-amino-6-(5-phosphoribosylamino)uracil reductase
VITLEPCAHQGRTGPCTEALIEAGIARVVFAVPDPSAAAGGGADVLRGAGVEVEAAVGASAAEAANREWLTALRLDRPFVTVKFAASLDGRVAAADGTSQWITGPDARADVHRLRAECDAVLVGTGTVIQDDPRLTVREVPAELRDRAPLRVVVGQRPVPSEAVVLTDGGPTLTVPTRDLGEVLAVLHEREIRSVLVEAGPTLTSAFLAAGLVDRVVAYVAPALLGEGRSAVEGIGVGTIGQALRLDDVDVDVIGRDVRIVGVPHQRKDVA